MRKLIPISNTAQDVFTACVDTLRDAGRKAAFNAVVGNVVAAENQYRAHAIGGSLYLIPEMANVGGTVSCDEMKKLYKNTFVKSVQTRSIYDTIKKLPINDICPLCGQCVVSTLDHYLAQTRHPSLTIVPVNLVPACDRCNINKLDFQPLNPEEQTLHPYFDDVENARWLFATVNMTTPASVVFRSDPPQYWPDILRKRVKNHFETFKLGSLYASHSGVEITNIRHHLRMVSTNGGIPAVRSFLKEQAVSSFQASLNSWRGATYDALAQSDWFCGGGFNNC